MTPDECLKGQAAEHVAHALDALSEPRRVLTIQYLSSLECGSEVGLRPVAKAVAAREHGEEPDQVDHPTYKSTRGALHQWHLPSLDRCGAIEYDEERSTIRIRPELRFYCAVLSLVVAWVQFE